MKNTNVKMTRDQMQSEALIIQCLLNSAMALSGDPDPDHGFTLIEMAHGRAKRLNSALDSVNAPKEMGA